MDIKDNRRIESLRIIRSTYYPCSIPGFYTEEEKIVRIRSILEVNPTDAEKLIRWVMDN